MVLFSEWRQRLLLGIAIFDEKHPHEYGNLKEIADLYAADYKPGWIGKAFKFFESRGLITGVAYVGTGPEDGIDVMLTAEGLESADAYKEATLKKARDIPASDRVVRLDDNSPERNNAIQALSDLEGLLLGQSNSLPLATEERRVLASEISSLRNRIAGGWIRVGEIANAITKGSPLVWLTEKVAENVVGALVGAALGALGLMLVGLVG